MDYVIDKQRLEKLIGMKGFKSINEFTRAHNLHRNTLGMYLNGKKSVFCDAVQRIAQALDVDPISFISVGKFSGSAASEFEQLLRFTRQLAENNSDLCFMLIGSRARSDYRDYSDWDIAVSSGPKKLATNEFLKLKTALEDLCEDFARKVDVVNLDCAPEWFLRGIDYQPELLGGNIESFSYVLGLLDGIKREQKAA